MNRKRLIINILFAWVCLMSCPCLASNLADQSTLEGEEATHAVKPTLESSVKEIEPGLPFKVLLRLKLSPGWHTYYKDPGDAGMPPKIDWVLPTGFQAGPIEWPNPLKFNDQGIITYGYKDEVVLATTITAPQNISGQIGIQANVKWLVCKDICVPGKAVLTISLPVKTNALGKTNLNGAQAASMQSYEPSVFNQSLSLAHGNFPLLAGYVLFAFIGGMILNLMPCVLPVVSIKLLTFVEQADNHPAQIFNEGLVFSAGIVSSFLAMSLFVIALKQAGKQIGWGFQFQDPAFLVCLAMIVLLLSLSLFGIFYISVPGQESLSRLSHYQGKFGTFCKGILATILSTPCTAPFLGAAMGFAFLQPPAVTILIFFTVGIGMALPYLLLTANPAWMRFLPKPGEWMNTFKQAMGFPLLATVIWLVWILAKQTGADAVLYTCALLLFTAFIAWLVTRMINLNTPPTKRRAVLLSATVAVGLALWACLNLTAQSASEQAEQGSAPIENHGGIAWKPFSVDALDEAVSSGHTVFVDFTADWCLTCKLNEQVVINTQPVIEKFKALNIVALKADWTRQNPSITAIMEKFGRSGVPLYVIFPAKDCTHPIVLPELITKSIVIDKLNQAAQCGK